MYKNIFKYREIKLKVFVI